MTTAGRGSIPDCRLRQEVGINYIVRATSFGVEGTGNYTLESSVGTLVAGTPLAAGESATGILSAADPANPNRPGTAADDFLLTGLRPGQEITLNYTSEDFDPFVALLNANTGEVIATNDDGGSGLNSRLNFTVQPGTDYVVRATSFAANATGDYRLDVNSRFSIESDLSTADSLNPDRAGRFQDNYRLLDLTPDQAVTLDVVGGFDTFLQLVDLSTGEVVAVNDDGGTGLNSRLTFTPVVGQDYGVRVTSFGAAETGDYTVTTTSGTLANIAPSSLIATDPFTGTLFEAQTTDGSGNNLTQHPAGPGRYAPLGHCAPRLR